MLLLDVAFWRDIIIIVWGALAAILVFVLILFTVVIGVGVRSLIERVRNLIDAEVTPFARSAREAASQVKGTAQFVSQTAVQPIVRTYGFIAGARRALAVVSGLTRRGRPHKGG